MFVTKVSASVLALLVLSAAPIGVYAQAEAQSSAPIADTNVASEPTLNNDQSPAASSGSPNTPAASDDLTSPDISSAADTTQNTAQTDNTALSENTRPATENPANINTDTRNDAENVNSPNVKTRTSTEQQSDSTEIQSDESDSSDTSDTSDTDSSSSDSPRLVVALPVVTATLAFGVAAALF
ncbi:hypothetical protein IW150_000793 [Coemansia sp. RSA 2607]|nr:hypothetical protein IW150_000793 [Coemansia sp. RSA 2607]